MGVPILYTNTATIRAVVGVTDKEVPDTKLTDQHLETQIKTALYGWVPTYEAIYNTGAATGATSDEVYQKDLLVSYCTFFGAVRIVEMIMALRSQVSNGKNEVHRFNVDWKELLSVFKGKLDEVKTLLENLLSTSTGGTKYFGSSIPSYDPVTNT